MHYVVGMTIKYCRKHLLHDLSASFLTEMPLFDDFIEQLSPGT